MNVKGVGYMLDQLRSSVEQIILETQSIRQV
jgi:hypothetical protein